MFPIWRRRSVQSASVQANPPRRDIRRLRTLLSVERLEDRVVPSTLIPVSSRRDLIFDPVRGLLDITTSNGSVQQFSVKAQQIIGNFVLAQSLNGGDTSPDGNFLYLANPKGPPDVVLKLDLSSFAVTNLNFSTVSGELGTWDVALASNGKGLVSTMRTSTGYVPLRQLNLNTGVFTIRNDIPGGRVAQNTLIHRSADRSLLLLTQPNNGIVMTYNANTDQLTPGPSFGPALANAPAAVNRNGTLIAVEVNGQAVIMDPLFNTRMTIPGLDGGVVFDPNQDVMYAVNSSAGQVIAYDTNTWAVKYQLAIGENTTPGQAFGNGVMAVSGDSRWLFLSTPSGVREFSLVNPNPATRFTITGNFNGITTAGALFSLNLVALDGYGQVASGYQGTVHFSSSDRQAGLPADYTFTLADAGVHTFSFTLKTAGSQSISMVDVQNPNLGLITPPITVNPGPLAGFRVDAPSAAAAGYACSAAFSAQDAYGNAIRSYTGTIHLTSSDPTAVLPADYTFTASDQGSHTLTMTFGTAGNQTITATDTQNGSVSGNGTVPVYNYIPGLHFTATASASTVFAGSPFTMTVTAYDEYNQVATRYVGTITFSSSDHGQGVVLPANYTFTAADAGIHTFNVTLVTAASSASVGFYDPAYGTTAGGGPPGGGTSGGVVVTVNPGAATQFVLNAPSTAQAGVSFNLTVTALDAYGNIATGYTGTVHFQSTDGAASLPADYTFVNGDNGVHTFQITLWTPGIQTVWVADLGNSSITGGAQVSL